MMSMSDRHCCMLEHDDVPKSARYRLREKREKHARGHAGAVKSYSSMPIEDRT